jgi:antitoxin YefM
MFTGIKQKTTVGKNGKIELPQTNLQEGTIVEVIVLANQAIENQKIEEDDTTYLLKSTANKKQLLKAIENVEKGNLIYVDLDEYEKNSI